MNPFRRKRLLISGLILFLTVASIGFGIVEPQTSTGRVVFHLGYAFPPTRATFLKFYHWTLASFNGGYIPSSVDTFLVQRLSNCRGGREWNAIIEFQLVQGAWRWGEAITQIDEKLKGAVINDLMSRGDTVQPRQAMEIFLLVESLRRGEYFPKGQFMRPYSSTDAIYPAVRERFQSWWGEGRLWPGNKSIDPLEGTGIFVHVS